MTNEETPLLDADIRKHEEVYNRFTPAQKRVIVALIALAGLVPREFPMSLCLYDSDDLFSSI